MTTTSIRFFTNGMRINGSRELCKVLFSLDNRQDFRECVTIYERSDNYHTRIPSDLFNAEYNDSVLIMDYFVSERAEVFPDHPLYRYLRANAIRAALKDMEPRARSLRARIEAGQISRWEIADALRIELEACEAKISGYYAELARLPQGQPSPADVAQAVAFVAERREQEIRETSARLLSLTFPNAEHAVPHA